MVAYPPKKTKAVAEAMKAAAARVLDLALIQETESSVLWGA